MSSTAPAAPAVEPEVARTLQLGHGAKLRKLAIRVTLAIAAIAVLVLGARWWRQRGVVPPPSYVTAPAARGELAITVTATGTLMARNLVAISSEVSGRVLHVLVDANDRVTRGEILAELDPEPFEAQVEQAEALVAQARAQLAQARATRREAIVTQTRVHGLVDAGVAATQDRDAADAAVERATAAVALAAASVRQATASARLSRTNLARAAVRSPIDGVVLARAVEVGQTVVAAFQSPVLFQIAEDLRAMKASIDIDEADIGLVHEGEDATFSVAAYLERRFTGHVVAVHNAARTIDRVVTYEAELDVDNADLALRPGMTVTVDIVARRISDALLVPGPALRFTPKGEAATPGADRISILRDDRPVAVAVEVLGQNDTQVAVASAELTADAAVIVNTR